MIKEFLEGVTMLKNLRRNFERFCARNRDKGIPNLMLYIAIGNLIVYLFSIIDPTNSVHSFLYFNPTLILHGQVWRLVTYIFTYVTGSNPLGLMLSLLSLYCYYWIGKNLEARWGVLRFNLFYLGGVLIMDIAALLLNTYADTYYLNLSLFLAFATLYPSMRFLLLFIIPIEARWLALLDLGLTLFGVITTVFPYNLFPLFALLNYFLFFGSEVLNLLPDSWQLKLRRKRARGSKTIPFPTGAARQDKPKEQAYTHKCTVCGRTDITNPELEFRYCSKCKGYHCYCIDHINNHVHIQ